MSNYLIEFRFQGRQKNDLKKRIFVINKKFKIFSKSRPVPHVTIVAPFKTKNQKRLVRDFVEICKEFEIIKFEINGFGTFDKARVVYVNINPSENIILFRKKLLDKLKKYCRLCKTDVSKSFIFTRIKKYSPHATLAMKLNPAKFQRIKDFIFRQKPIKKKYLVVKATLIKEKKIFYEYDFVLKRLLNRREAKSEKIYSETIKRLKNDRL